jgi:small subunit ribosomal protein S2
MPYVNERWLGGTLTNFKVMLERIGHLKDLEKKKKSEEWEKYTKKERHEMEIEIRKLNEKFGGIKEMTKLPDVLFVVGVRDDKLSIKEAKMKEIPIVGLCDTNADPTTVDYPIPANDDASSALKLMIGAVVGVLK